MSALVQNSVEVMGPLRWVFTAVLLALALINWAAGRGHIELNSTIGIRIPPLQRSESAWRAGHAAGVTPAALAFAVSLICSVVGLFAGVVVWGVVVAFVGGLVWSITAAVRAATAALPAAAR